MKNLSVYKKNSSVSRQYILVLAIPISSTLLINIDISLCTFVLFIVFIFNSYYEILPKYSVNQNKKFEHSINKSSIKSCGINFETELSQLLSRFIQLSHRYQIAKPKYVTIHLNDYFYQDWCSIKNDQKFSELINSMQISCTGISKRSDFVVIQVCNKWELFLSQYTPNDLYLLQIIQMQILLSLGYSDYSLALKTFISTLRFLLEECLNYRLESGKIQPINQHDILSEYMFSQLLEISVTGLTKRQVEKLKNNIEYAFLSQKNQTISNNMFDLFTLLYKSPISDGFYFDSIRNLDNADGIFLKNDEKTIEFKNNVHELVERIFSFDIIESYWEIENREMAIIH